MIRRTELFVNLWVQQWVDEDTVLGAPGLDQASTSVFLPCSLFSQAFSSSLADGCSFSVSRDVHL
jgi:hypothetical protein